MVKIHNAQTETQFTIRKKEKLIGS